MPPLSMISSFVPPAKRTAVPELPMIEPKLSIVPWPALPNRMPTPDEPVAWITPWLVMVAMPACT